MIAPMSSAVYLLVMVHANLQVDTTGKTREIVLNAVPSIEGKFKDRGECILSGEREIKDFQKLGYQETDYHCMEWRMGKK